MSNFLLLKGRREGGGFIYIILSHFRDQNLYQSNRGRGSKLEKFSLVSFCFCWRNLELGYKIIVLPKMFPWQSVYKEKLQELGRRRHAILKRKLLYHDT